MEEIDSDDPVGLVDRELSPSGAGSAGCDGLSIGDQSGVAMVGGSAVPNGQGLWAPRMLAGMDDLFSYAWRAGVTDEEMVLLTRSHGGRAVVGWWDTIRAHSLGWVSARDEDGLLVGFVNVAWDGGDHAFVLDTKTHGLFQRRGIGTQLVRHAAVYARRAGCEWLHVDYQPDLARFYRDACSFRPTDAGLIHLPSWPD